MGGGHHSGRVHMSSADHIMRQEAGERAETAALSPEQPVCEKESTQADQHRALLKTEPRT